MLTKAQAKIGNRVKWQSLDASIPPSFGTITANLGDGEIAILYDDGEDGTTFVDSGASCVHFVSEALSHEENPRYDARGIPPLAGRAKGQARRNRTKQGLQGLRRDVGEYVP